MFFKKKEDIKDDETGEVKLKCPRCSVHMRKIQKEDVVIDVCGKCEGMWLDQGEIEKLQAIAAKKFADQRRASKQTRPAVQKHRPHKDQRKQTQKTLKIIKASKNQ